MNETVILAAVVTGFGLLICFLCGLVITVILYLAAKIQDIIHYMPFDNLTRQHHNESSRDVMREFEKQRSILELNRVDKLRDEASR